MGLLSLYTLLYVQVKSTSLSDSKLTINYYFLIGPERKYYSGHSKLNTECLEENVN